MKYDDTDDLPDGVKNNLPSHAQEIYKEAFNSARSHHIGEEDVEQTAHKIAWSAVKSKYEKSGSGNWTKIED